MIDVNKVKVGDKVVCHQEQVYGGNNRKLPVGYKGVVTHVYGMFISVDNKLGRKGEPVFNSDVFEVIKEEKQVFDLKTQSWFIRINSEEEFNAANEWLKEKLGYCLTCNYRIEFIAITNTDTDGQVESHLMWLSDEHMEKYPITRREIKLTYKTETKVDSVQYLVIETDKQRKLRELKDTALKIQQQIDELGE